MNMDNEMWNKSERRRNLFSRTRWRMRILCRRLGRIDRFLITSVYMTNDWNEIEFKYSTRQSSKIRIRVSPAGRWWLNWNWINISYFFFYWNFLESWESHDWENSNFFLCFSKILHTSTISQWNFSCRIFYMTIWSEKSMKILSRRQKTRRLENVWEKKLCLFLDEIFFLFHFV